MEPAEVTVLVHRAAEGDSAAWNAIVDEYAGLLWSVVRGFRLNEAQAADAVQTTWLRLVEHVADLREPEHVAGWLKTTAHRVCLQVIRQGGREQLTDWDEDRSPGILRGPRHDTHDTARVLVVRCGRSADPRRRFTGCPVAPAVRHAVRLPAGSSRESWDHSPGWR